MNPKITQKLRLAVLTFVAAFLGALAWSGGIPQTLADWKTSGLKALAIAIGAELFFLRTEFSKALAAATSIDIATTTTTTTLASSTPVAPDLPPVFNIAPTPVAPTSPAAPASTPTLPEVAIAPPQSPARTP